MPCTLQLQAAGDASEAGDGDGNPSGKSVKCKVRLPSHPVVLITGGKRKSQHPLVSLTLRALTIRPLSTVPAPDRGHGFVLA